MVQIIGRMAPEFALEGVLNGRFHTYRLSDYKGKWVGRSVDETLRVLQAFQYVSEHGEVCPADWKPGAKVMKADGEKSKEHFAHSK